MLVSTAGGVGRQQFVGFGLASTSRPLQSTYSNPYTIPDRLSIIYDGGIIGIHTGWRLRVEIVARGGGKVGDCCDGDGK